MIVSASIVVYNEDKEVLKHAIQSFLNLKYKKELVVVDNSPTNNLESFCEQFELKYIHSMKNIGFGAGHNLAFSKISVDSEFHFIINPDTYFEPKDIESFVSWFQKSDNISLAVPNILNPDGTQQNVVRNIPTVLSVIKRKLNINSDIIKIEVDKVFDIPFAHGCFMVFKKQVFRDVNGFDERFFMYMEDVDIFIRSKPYGRTVMNSNYSVYHEYRKSSSKSFKLFVVHIVSLIKFFLKYRKNNKI